MPVTFKVVPDEREPEKCVMQALRRNGWVTLDREPVSFETMDISIQALRRHGIQVIDERRSVKA